MLDRYFRSAIIFDILISAIVCVLSCFLMKYSIFQLPDRDILMATVSDIANVGFTSAGFVLTFLTLLVSFKSGLNPIRKKKSLEDTYEGKSVFNLFLNSELYDVTVRHLKNGVKILILVAITGYFIKLTLGINYLNTLFYFNITGITIISLVLWRSLLVLSGVLKIQNNSK